MPITVIISYYMGQICDQLTFLINGIPYDGMSPPSFTPGTMITIEAIDNTIGNCCFRRRRIQNSSGVVMRATDNPLDITAEESLATPGVMYVEVETELCLIPGAITFTVVDHCGNMIDDAAVTIAAPTAYPPGDYGPFPNPGPGIYDWTVERPNCTTESGQIEIIDPTEPVLIPVVLDCDRECCLPRYKNVDILTAKANCICSRFQVEMIPMGPNINMWIIYDTCTPDDNSFWATGFQEVAFTMNPDYLLQLMECICESNITSNFTLPLP